MGQRQAAAAPGDRRLIPRKIVWTDEAIAHLEAITAYISAFNLAAALTLGERLVAVADSLADFSDRGRDVGEGRREMTTV